VIALDAEEIRATYYAVSAFDRGRALAGRPVPPSVRALLDRLDLAIRCPVSSTRHEMYGGRGELEEEWIGTALAAKVLDWHPRRVQRRAADLDGQAHRGPPSVPSPRRRGIPRSIATEGN
jgi:hypothetical protein